MSIKSQAWSRIRSNRYANSFNKSSLTDTKEAVSSAINSEVRQEKLTSALNSKDKRIAQQRSAHIRSYLTQSLLSAGARKTPAENVALLIAIATNNNGSRVKVSQLKLADLGLDTKSAANIYNNLIDSTVAGPGLRRALHDKSSNHFDHLVYAMERGGSLQGARNAARVQLQQVVDATDGADWVKSQAINLLGVMLSRQVSFERNGRGELATDRKGNLKAVLFVQTREEVLLQKANDGNSLKGFANQTLDSFEQKVTTAKIGANIALTQAGKKVIQAERGLLKASGKVAGSLAAASRPVAAAVAAPVLLGLGTAAVGVGAAAATAAVGLGLAAAGTAAAASPVWATGMVLADGFSGGPGLAARSKAIANGDSLRQNLGLPSKQSVSAFGSRLGSMFKNAGKGFAIRK